MKKIIIVAVLTGFSIQMYGQEVFYEAKLKREEMPTAILEAIETDFPGFVVTEYTSIPIEIVEEDVFVDTVGDPGSTYDTYQLELKEGSDRSLIANYDSSGKLLSTEEYLKDITPPARVRNSIAQKFPGWTIEKDAFKMVHFAGKSKKERFKLFLEKNDKKMKVFTDENGTILKVS